MSDNVIQRRTLLLHVPVIHAGYLGFFVRNKDRIENIYLIPDSLIEKLSLIKPDIAAIPTNEMQNLLSSLGHTKVAVFSENIVEELSKKPLLLINDRISRELQKVYFLKSDIEWDSVFLRWDIDSIHTEESTVLPETHELFDQDMIHRAYVESEKSSDWWRHVGALLVRDKHILYTSYNHGMPSDHTSYQRGAVRDFLKPGEQPELVDTIHAEQDIISRAAKEGVALEGTTLYVTHFPCPVCAKLIITAGIKKCFFSEGWSTLASAPLFESAGIEIVKVVP